MEVTGATVGLEGRQYGKILSASACENFYHSLDTGQLMGDPIIYNQMIRVLAGDVPV